jgi:hypothetical protein
MQKVYRVEDLLIKVVQDSFLVDTPKGSVRVVSGTLFGYNEGKYFLLNEVIEKILDVVEIRQSRNIDVYDVHDLLYPSWIELGDLVKTNKIYK